MATKTDKEIKLELLQIAAEIANTNWLESCAKVKFEAEKSNATTYTLPADARLRASIKNAGKLFKFLGTTTTTTAPSASAVVAP